MPVSEDEVAALLDEPAEPQSGGVSEDEVAALLQDDTPDPQGDAFLRRSFGEAFQGNVERKAAVLRLAEDTRAPASDVERNYDRLRTTWEASQFDPAAWRRENPTLARWLLDNQHLAPIVVQDEKVSGLTKFLRRINAELVLGRQAIFGQHEVQPLLGGEPVKAGNEALAPSAADVAEAERDATGAPRQVATVDDARAQEGRALTGLDRWRVPLMVWQDAIVQGERQRTAFSILTGELRGIDTWEDEKRLVDLRNQGGARDYGEAGVLEGIARDVATAASSHASTLTAGTAAAAVTGLAAAVATKGRLAGPALALGFKAGSTASSFIHETGDAYEQYRAIPGISREAAQGGALLYGALSAGVETWSFGAAERSLGPAAEAFLKGRGKAFIRDLLLTAAGRKAAAGVLKAWGQRSATEGLEEFVQTVMEDRIAQGLGDTTVTSGGTIEKGVRAATSAAVGTAAIGGGQALGARFGTEVLAAASRRSQSTAQAIADAADSPTVRASPAAVADLIERETAATGEPVTHLYVTPEAVAELGDDAPVDQATVRDHLAAGQKLEIPVAEYLERWAPKVGDRLADHLAVRPGYLSKAEEAAQGEALEAEAQEIAAAPVEAEHPEVAEQVETSAAGMGLQALPQAAIGDGYEAYLEDLARAKSAAAKRADLAAKRDQLRTQEAWWKEEESREQESAAAEYEALPARRAERFLRGVIDGEKGTPIKLDYEAVKEVLGAEGARKILTTKDGTGASPRDVADLLEYPGGRLRDRVRSMLIDITQLPAKRAWVKQRASERMTEKHPSVLEDRIRLREEVARGLHGDMTAQALLREGKALGSRVRAQAVKRAAAITVEREKVGTLNPHAALVAERTAGRKKFEAAVRGNNSLAAVHWQQQLLSLHRWRELDAARDEREAFLGFAGDLRKETSRQRVGKASPVLRDGIDTLLEALQLREPIQRDQPAASLNEVLDELGEDTLFDPDVIGGILARPRTWKDLTVAEMRQVDAALKNMRAGARKRTTAMVDGKRRDQDEVAGELVARAFSNRKDRGPVSSTEDTEGALRTAKHYVDAFDAANLRIETMCRWLDGERTDGPWFRALSLPLQQGKHREADILRDLAKPVLDALERVPKAVRDRLTDRVDGAALFPNHISDEIDPPSRLVELAVLWLNAGNESNLRRLRDGRGISLAEIEASIARHGTKEMMDWLQAVLDAAESLKKPSFDMEERLNGVRPQEIPARPISTPWGAYRGGYWPAVYERRVGARTQNQVARGQPDFKDPTYTRPGTSHGYLKRRVETYNGVISLSPRTIYSHFAQVAHDLAFREAVQSVGSLLLRPDVDRALRRTLGQERAAQFLASVKDVAQMRGTDVSQNLRWLDKLLSKMRGNAARGILGYRPRTAIGDFANLAVAMTNAGVRPDYLAGALADYTAGLARPEAGNPAKDLAFGKSGELRSMHNQWAREFGNQTGKLVRGKVARSMAPVLDNAFWFMELSFESTAVPIWTAVYNQAKDRGRSEPDAVIDADAVIRDLFPSHSAVDQAAWLRNKGWLGYSQIFMSYLNTVYQRGREAIEPVFQGEGIGDAASRVPAAAARAAALLVSSGLFAEFLTGRGAEKDETWQAWALRKAATQAVAPIPFVNDVAYLAEQAVRGFRPTSRTPSPFAMLGEATIQALAAAHDDNARKTYVATMRALGVGLGIPMTPTTEIGPYLYDVAQGEAEPGIEPLLYGNREGRPANPISVGRDLVKKLAP